MAHEPEIRQVEQITWPDSPTACGQMITANETRELRYENRYMGDRNEEWVLLFEHGVEKSRHNCRFIDTIIWKQSAAATV